MDGDTERDLPACIEYSLLPGLLKNLFVSYLRFLLRAFFVKPEFTISVVPIESSVRAKGFSFEIFRVTLLMDV